MLYAIVAFLIMQWFPDWLPIIQQWFPNFGG